MSSGFVTEAEAAEARTKRQAEWEKVRSPDQPIEMPVEPYDGRSLFERLQEQKAKKDLEFEETHKLKNMIRGLDDDEVDFLELVDRNKMMKHKILLLEDHKEIEEFRQRVATLQEKEHDEKVELTVKKKIATESDTSVRPKRPSQKSILTGAVVKKRKISSDEEDNKKETDTKCSKSNNTSDTGAFKVIGILPGLGNYDSCSSSESEEDFDIKLPTSVSGPKCL